MTRAEFAALRRTYRAACRLNAAGPDGERAVRARVAATTALRLAINRWDTCEPARWHEGRERPKRGARIATNGRPHVAAACTRWLAAH